MTAYFVRSGGSNTAPYDTWAKAATTLATAAAASAAGDTIWVADDHAESTAGAVTITFPGSNTTPSFCYCADHTVASPGTGDLKTTGTVTTTGSNNLSVNGCVYIYGLTFTCGGGSGPIFGGASQTLEACIAATSNAAGLIFVGSNGRVTFINTQASFANAACGLHLSNQADFIWKNTASALIGAAVPTGLFKTSNVAPARVWVEGVDLSAATSGTGSTLVSPATQNVESVIFKDCKLGSGVIVCGTINDRSLGVDLIRCDSGATNYRDERYRYDGTHVVETSIVRTGGATDGTTLIAWKAVTTAKSQWLFPFELQPITLWNDSTSAITTLTLYGTTTGGGVPKDDEIWFDVEYLGSSLTPQGSFQTTTKANNLAASAATNNSADGSTWAGGGAGNGFKIVCPSFTPAQKGPLTIYVRAAKASTTWYIDPLPSISGVTVSKSYIGSTGAYINELSSGSGSGVIGSRIQLGM